MARFAWRRSNHLDFLDVDTGHQPRHYACIERTRSWSDGGMVMLRNFFRAGILAFTALSIAATAHAQVDRATLTGIIKDPSGSVIPGAQVKITSLATNSMATTPTSSDG